MQRRELEDTLEAFALDLLDGPATAEVEESLRHHPDLVDKVAAIRSTLVALAYEDSATSPRPLRHAVLSTAIGSRDAGHPVDAAPPASAFECYAESAHAMSLLLNNLEPANWQTPTIYEIPVVEMVQHLSGVDQLLVARLRGEEPSGEATTGHVECRDQEADLSDPGAVLARWRTHSARVAETAVKLSDDELARRVDFFGITMATHAMLVARAFELWSHAEDIRRAVGLPLRTPSAPVLRTMANAAVGVLGEVVSVDQNYHGKTVRITLTGDGGGSWLAPIGPRSEAKSIEPTAAADATLVADVVDFCRLCADRIRPPAQLETELIGDRDLAHEVLRLAPLLADFGQALNTD